MQHICNGCTKMLCSKQLPVQTMQGTIHSSEQQPSGNGPLIGAPPALNLDESAGLVFAAIARLWMGCQCSLPALKCPWSIPFEGASAVRAVGWEEARHGQLALSAWLVRLDIIPQPPQLHRVIDPVAGARIEGHLKLGEHPRSVHQVKRMSVTQSSECAMHVPKQ